MKSMGVATGCGCKEVYCFPHITYVSLLLCSFLQHHPNVFYTIEYTVYLSPSLS